MYNKLHNYTRIVIALVAAVLVSEFLVKDVFLGATPAVRPDLADALVERSLALVNIDNYRAFFGGRRADDLASTPYQPTLVPGVYAKETENTHLIEVRVDEVNWVEVPYQKKDGTTKMIKIPAGTEAPPPGLF